MPRHKYTTEQINKAIELRHKGLSMVKIADQLGFSGKDMIYYHTSKGAKENKAKTTRKLYLENREKRLKQMSEYGKKMRAKSFPQP